MIRADARNLIRTTPRRSAVAVTLLRSRHKSVHHGGGGLSHHGRGLTGLATSTARRSARLKR